MLRKVSAAALAAGLVLLPAVHVLLARAQVASGAQTHSNKPSSPPSIFTTAILDASNLRATLAGLSVFLLDDYHGRLPVAVRVDCDGQSETPPLAIDAAAYGANARLLNLTRLPEHGCSSYEVTTTTLVAQIASEGGPVGADVVPDGIGISVHYSGLRSADELQKKPAIFVFNPVHGNWTEAKSFAPSVPEPQRAYATLSEQHQRIIGGVIAVPNSLQAEPAKNGPSSLAKPLEQLSPVDGYLAVDRIEPDSKGAYSVNLPLLLRPSRGPGPSFSIRYNSQGSPGVLGRGWDLFISTIDVRGPSPIYHPAYETEDYVLDGMDLIALDANGNDIPPLYKGGPILPRIKSMRVFRLRNNSSALIVRRYGDAPGSYFWEVWDPNSHVTKLYGGKFSGNNSQPAFDDGNGLLSETIATSGGSRDVIGQWGLTQEFDSQPARNGARYVYVQSDAKQRGCDPSWGGPCKGALRLDWVEYNLAFGLPDKDIDRSGVTRVDFAWEKRTPTRFNSDGRLGFFRAQEYWLRGLDVRYQPEKDKLFFAGASESDRLPPLPFGPPLLAEQVLFARHLFTLTNGDSPRDACMNFDRVLQTYEVWGNSRYDSGIAPDKQTFTFDYEGEKSRNGDDCTRQWLPPDQLSSLGTLPATDIGGNFSFPTGLLNDLGFGLLSGQSLLGTGRTEETGASLYAGVGFPGIPSLKELTVGIKAGANFAKSEGNSTLIDVTGDGIDDIVYRDEGKLFYCAGVRADDEKHSIRYPQDRCGTIEGISDLSISSMSTLSVGVEIYPGFTTFAGVGFNGSNSDSYVYFTDRDGDGLMDLVAYGQVFYNQGEDKAKKVVRFSPKSALTPPISDNVPPSRLQNHFPPDVRNTIKDIETRLEGVSRRLKDLDYTQTTVAWEAPLDGTITITGKFESGISTPDKDNAGALGVAFGPEQFDALHDEVDNYQKQYIDKRFSCGIWTWAEYCHEKYSDPFSPHYMPVEKANIGFIATPTPEVLQLSLYRRENKKVVLCSDANALNAAYDLSTLIIYDGCRPDGQNKERQIQVKTGDVLYVNYNVHPHFNKWQKPTLKVSYTQVDKDPAFKLFKEGDPQRILDALNCKWKDESAAKASVDCLLTKQTRYEFDLRAGAITSAPTSVVELPPGTERVFGGRFDIPADLANDYQVFFDVLGLARPIPPSASVPSPAGPSTPSFEDVPPSALQRLFRLDVSASCRDAVGVCTFNISRPCDGVHAAECASFTENYLLATRLVIEHKVTELPVRNIANRLSALAWRIPPNVTSLFSDIDVPAGAPKKRIAVYLPVAMGEPDLEYLRVENGNFNNPDTELTDTQKTIDFKDILLDEKLNVDLARIRQTIGLCGFADEIFGFLGSHFSENGQPYAADYTGYWRAKIDVFKTRCDNSRKSLSNIDFTEGNRPEAPGTNGLTNGLRLPEILQNLPYAEQMTSAETLLERVLRNLAIEPEFLTDSPRLTRRGYRLPIKVNPLDCEVIALLGQHTDPITPISSPIYGAEKPCAYRIATNFAMQELKDLGIDDAQAANIREILARFADSHQAAFNIKLTATINGVPLSFHELTGDRAGNEPCGPTDKTVKTCMGNYGTIEPIEAYFYPMLKPGQKNDDPHGDVFQRITVNKRTSRAVAFSNSIMDYKVPTKPQCPRNYPVYRSLGEMEAKQDCLFQGTDISENQKYARPETYEIAYTIGENNQFVGRDKVFEFRANPLDVLELHFRLSGAQNAIPRTPDNPNDTITGKFSIFDAVDRTKPWPMGLREGRHLIPRSPSQILPDGDVNLACPQAPASPGTSNPPGGKTRDRVGNTPLPVSCRPWTRLGWTEVLLGAQYRTYSDAQKIQPGQPSKTYSVLRRRELLRLQPEIEVAADEYVLEYDQNLSALPMVKDLQSVQHEVFNRHDPNVPKTGGDWAFFAATANPDGSLRQPPPFVATPFVLPHDPNVSQQRAPPSLRYDPQVLRHLDPGHEKTFFDGVSSACGPPGKPNYVGCKDTLGSRGEQALSLKDFDYFALVHRFVGPTLAETEERATKENPNRPATSVCAAENPTEIASCWQGIDDTVFLESAVIDTADRPALYSVSALKGFERPPLAEFNFQFDAYKKLVRIDCESPGQSCASPPDSDQPAAPGLPNRPTPPQPGRAIEVFAPVQSSVSSSISQNAGFNLLNVDASNTSRNSTRMFLDVNGDGYPDVISNGTVELTSPVGLPRRDWWNYFRAQESAPTPDFQLQAPGFDQQADSSSRGVGSGLSPSTFAQTQKYRTTGSPDANVDPGFGFSLENGHDEKFTELRDFNGDGLPDKISEGRCDGDVPCGAAANGLTLQFNAGNGLGPKLNDPLKVNGTVASGVYFNTSHSAGFGVRLGASFGAGSVAVGAGLANRGAGSQAALIDFTGDGRPDIVLPADNGQFIVYPNLGNGFGPGRIHQLQDWVSEAPDQDSGTQLSETTLVDAGVAYTYGFQVWLIRVVFTPGVKWARNQTRELLNIRDVNGDGVPDVVSVSGRFLPSSSSFLPSLDATTVKTQVHYNPDGKYHLLTGVQNPTGSKWVLQHGLFGNSGPEHGRAVWALTGVAHFDGYNPPTPGAVGPTLPPHGQDILLTTYDYSGGYFNRAERQFYGFATRTSTTYGCDSTAPGGNEACLEAVRKGALAPASLKAAGYLELQTVAQTFSNRDFLTQGMELSRTVLGVKSAPIPTDDKEQAVSRNVFRYSIDDLASLTTDEDKCKVPSNASGDSWSTDTLARDKTHSVLSPSWNGSLPFGVDGKVFGNASICGTDPGKCAQTLGENMCRAGFVREQKAFWAQQSASVRQRLITLETFGDVPVVDLAKADELALRSVVAFDYDQWGQVLTFDSVGEASSTWTPAVPSSANATVTYAQRQGLNALRSGPHPDCPDGKPCGYPMLGLAEQIKIFAGSWDQTDGRVDTPLRAREAVYPDDGRGNPSDICSYPGGAGFKFTPGMCLSFARNMRTALNDGYSTMQSASRFAYDNTVGLPKGASNFNAIIHQQLVAYDPFGNLTHAISPLSQDKEWIERRFDYTSDPFRRTPTSTKLTRCVNDVPGIGIDSPDLEPIKESLCTFGLAGLPDPVQRKAITHASQTRIDTHFGTAVETRDINGNSILYDFDRWGRLGLIARSWGKPPRENPNKALKDRLDLAAQKVDRFTFTPNTKVNDWRILAVADYRQLSDGVGLLRSNLRRFESSDSYSGLLGKDNTTRETAAFSDGFGRPIQTIREADVCLGIAPSFMDGANALPSDDLAKRCTQIATGVVTPSAAVDALGRDLQSFESYSIDPAKSRENSDIRFTDPVPAPAKSEFLTRTTYDGAGRPLLVESRFAVDDDDSHPGTIKGTAQYRYSIVPEDGSRLARFEAFSLSPRCTASATWSDARGLKRTIFEDQQNFYPPSAGLPLGSTSQVSYLRDHAKTSGYCVPIGTIADSQGSWAAARTSVLNSGSQPSQVFYTYDPLQQLEHVEYPLHDTDREAIDVRFDLLGRTVELHEPNSGCTRYAYDGLNLLISESGFRYEYKPDTPCGTSSKVRNEKSYTYSGGRLIQMEYHSLEEQGGPADQRDTVRFYYDRYPYAARFGEILETLRFVPNDEANQRFVDVTGRKCDNCIGQATLVSDRTGARSFSFSELGLPSREVRSIVAPLHNVKQSPGKSETYLPEAAFYEVDNSYTAFGDPVQENFSESAPMNPAKACLKERDDGTLRGVDTCLARFTIGRKYAPDGAIAQLLFNGKPLINAAQDALGRPAVRWTSNGIATGYMYDPMDLRLNQMTTLTAARRGTDTPSLPVQVDGYQYDGGGNVVGHANTTTPTGDYGSSFVFQYDAVNRLTAFKATASKIDEHGGSQSLTSDGTYAYDIGHRMTSRSLTITGNPGTRFQRNWTYTYGNDPGREPLHAPCSIMFTINNEQSRIARFGYDDIGRMTRIGTDAIEKDRQGCNDNQQGNDALTPLLSNRAMTWDAEGRLLRVRGVKDAAIATNENLLREDYIYDSRGNRALKIDHPQVPGQREPAAKESAAATIYMTPFYSRPYDGRGTVQLSQGNLPAASLAPPADQSEDPLVSYLYADLPVGSMTARVTAFGEPSNADATVIARREYSPYGLELTSDTLATTGKDGGAPLSVFHGKELDRVTNFSSFGARYYSRDLGIWLKPDQLLPEYLRREPEGGKFGTPNFSVYQYTNGNPIVGTDYSGLDTAVAVGGPTKGNPFGHVAISFTGEGVYSYGTNTPLGGNFTDYLAKQATYRASSVYILHTTPKQEAQMKAEILKYRDVALPDPVKGIKDILSDPSKGLNELRAACKDTCATRTQSALEAGGISSILLPLRSPFPRSTEYLVERNDATAVKIPKGGDIPSSLSIFNKRDDP